jgi:hypothetical protein
MMKTVLRGLLLQAICSSLCSTLALAQWRINLEVGSDRFWGGSRELAGEHRSFRPYRPTVLGLGIDRLRERVGLGLQLLYYDASLGLEGSDAVIAVKGIFTTLSIAPEIHYRLAQLADNQLRLHAGPLFEIWGLSDEATRFRAGGQLGMSLDVPLGPRIGGSLLGGAALIASPFNEDELTPEYERAALWRRRLALRITYRL